MISNNKLNTNVISALSKSNSVYKSLFTNKSKEDVISTDKLLVRDSEDNFVFKTFPMSYLIASGVGVSWSEILNKPSTFAPTAHTHMLSDISNLSSLSITESQISDLSHFSPTSLLVDYSFVDNSTNWDMAYSWGDHSTEGYLTSFTETDPVFTAWDKSTGISITESQISDLGAYIIEETDPIFSAWDKSTGITITESQISDLNHFTPTSLLIDYSFTDNSTNWNTAYNWGNHAEQGYVTGTPWTSEGYLTSLGNALTDDDFISNGIMIRTSSGVYSTITDNSSTWNSLVSFPGFTSLITDYGVSLATVAISGSYNDLSDTPTVGTGDVIKVGTPIDNQVGVWTGDGTIEGTNTLMYNNNKLTVIDSISIQKSSTEPGSLILETTGSNYSVYLNPNISDYEGAKAHILGTQQTLSSTGAKLLSVLNYSSEKFSVDKDGNINIPTGSEYRINGISIGVFSGFTDLPTDYGITLATVATSGSYNDLSDKPTFGTGDVTKVGTPVNNQIGIWTGDGTIEGDSGLQWNGSTMTIISGTDTLNLTNDTLRISPLSVIKTALLPDRTDGTGEAYLFDTTNLLSTSNIAAFKNAGTALLTLDGSGNVNIPSGAEYRINGVSIATGGMVYPTGSGIPIVSVGTSWGTTITDNSTAWNAAEPGLGNPSTNGYLLSSTTAGVRSWVAPFQMTYGSELNIPFVNEYENGFDYSDNFYWSTTVLQTKASTSNEIKLYLDTTSTGYDSSIHFKSAGTSKFVTGYDYSLGTYRITHGSSISTSYDFSVDGTSGNVGIGVSPSSTYKLYIGGTVYASGNITANSDIRVKTDIKNINGEFALSGLNKINPISYRFKDDKRHNICGYQYGYSAQELYDIFPNAVEHSKDDIWGVRAITMSAINSAAIKQVKSEIDLLKDKIIVLENKTKNL